jgi:hypothetical protein
MRVIEAGHIYELDHLDGDDKSTLTFVNREAHPHEGVQTQEVLRALINRTQYCDRCERWEGNDTIIYCLRMALVLHEFRAIERKIHNGVLTPEHIVTGPDGHFSLPTKTVY